MKFQSLHKAVAKWELCSGIIALEMAGRVELSWAQGQGLQASMRIIQTRSQTASVSRDWEKRSMRWTVDRFIQGWTNLTQKYQRKEH